MLCIRPSYMAYGFQIKYFSNFFEQWHLLAVVFAAADDNCDQIIEQMFRSLKADIKEQHTALVELHVVLSTNTINGV